MRLGESYEEYWKDIVSFKNIKKLINPIYLCMSPVYICYGLILSVVLVVCYPFLILLVLLSLLLVGIFLQTLIIVSNHHEHDKAVTMKERRQKDSYGLRVYARYLSPIAVFAVVVIPLSLFLGIFCLFFNAFAASICYFLFGLMFIHLAFGFLCYFGASLIRLFICGNDVPLLIWISVFLDYLWEMCLSFELYVFYLIYTIYIRPAVLILGILFTWNSSFLMYFVLGCIGVFVIFYVILITCFWIMEYVSEKIQKQNTEGVDEIGAKEMGKKDEPELNIDDEAV